MNEFIKLQNIIIPEIKDLMLTRYDLLKTIEYYQPIGRRVLSDKNNLSERCLRGEIEFLKEKGLINVNPSGMTITLEGKTILQKLQKYISELKGLNDLEDELAKLMNVGKVLIIPGSLDKHNTVKDDMGKAAFEYLAQQLHDNMILAITGGSSTLALANNANTSYLHNIVVVPGIGGNRSSLENQANVVAAKLANNISGKYYLLHLPQQIEEETYSRMIEDPEIYEVINYINNADAFIFGLSSLELIAVKRRLTDEQVSYLKSLNAIAEAYGCYFNQSGEVVYRTGNVGIKHENLSKIKTVISIAGGKSKAKAIIAVNRGRENNVLITDESAAHEIYELLKGGF